MITRISFIITSYNNKKSILRCIRSARANFKGNITGEIIVVDDCSTDGGFELLKKYKNKYDLKIFKTTKNMGPSAARNIGLREASGDYVNFIDGDDYILANKISKQLAFIKNNKTVLSYTDCLVVGKDSAYLLKNAWPNKSGYIFNHLLNGSCFAIHSVLIPKKICKEYYFDEGLRQAEDYEYWLRIARNYRFEFIDEALVVYNLNDNNLTKNITEALSYTEKVYRRVLKSNISTKQKEIVRSRIKQLHEQSKLENGSRPSIKSRIRLKLLKRAFLLRIRITELSK